MPAQGASQQARPVPAPAATPTPLPQPNGSLQLPPGQELGLARKRTPVQDTPALVPRPRTWSASLPVAAGRGGPAAEHAELRPVAAAPSADRAAQSIRPAARSMPAGPAAPPPAAPLGSGAARSPPALPMPHVGSRTRSHQPAGAPERLGTQLSDAKRAAAEGTRPATPVPCCARMRAPRATSGICAQVDGGSPPPSMRMVRLFSA